MIYKILHKNLIIEQREIHYNWEWTRELRKGKQFMFHYLHSGIRRDINFKFRW